MNWNEIIEAVRDGESLSTRFLTSVESGADLCQIIVSMANTLGGKIIIGFDLNNCHLVGSTLDQKFISDRLLRFTSQNIPFSVSIVEKNSKHIVVVHVAEGKMKPYKYKNQIYVMEGTISRIAFPNEVKEMNQDVENLSMVETKSDIQKKNGFFDRIDDFDKDLDSITEELLGLTRDDDEDQIIIESSPKVRLNSEENNSFGGIFEKYIHYTKDTSLNQRQKKAIAFILKEGQIQNKLYRELFKVSHKTAHIELVDLVKKDYIETQGAGRSSCYIRKEI